MKFAQPTRMTKNTSNHERPPAAMPATIPKRSPRKPVALETTPEQRVASQSAARMHAPSAKPTPNNPSMGRGTHSPSNTPSTYSPATISMGCFIY